VEELHVQLAFHVVPQGVAGVVLNGVELLRRHVGQRSWQDLLGVDIAAAS